jgi:catechol 2,3-dioxygenase-like lactoylglutathione lyase family enzyme
MMKLAYLILINVLMNVPVSASESENPSIASGVPFFYYHDLQRAADWYENKLGLKIVTNESWVVIFELTPTSYLGLVSASGGSLKPTKNKGALLSIETADLEGWWDKVKDTEGINVIHGIESGANGMIEEFRMYDPEGYIVEFFRWHSSREESNKYVE